MEIRRIGTQPSQQGSAEYFTGRVRVDPLFEPTPLGNVTGISVTFEPGARTAWHTHPQGQVLIVTSGCGRVQSWGSPLQEIFPGDIVTFAPNEKHWHGAAPSSPLTHIAIYASVAGTMANWMEHVSDDQYLEKPMTK